MNDLNIDWRWVLARGILGIVFGALVLLFPISALITFALLFAIYVVGDGVMALSSAWHMRDQKGRGLLIFEGVIGIIAGVLAIFYPGAVLLALVILMSVWALLSGAIELYTAIAYRKILPHPVLLGAAGLASVLFGLIVAFWPITGALTLIAMFGFYSIFFGALFTFWSIRLKQNRTLSLEAHAV